MTILAAFWSRDGRPAAAACAAMLEAQGAGGRGRVRDCGEMALGQGALHGPGGEGPVAGAGGALTLAADVRLDNREDLLAELGLGERAGNACADAPLMMLCFERWGEEAVRRFVGEFALALWDVRSHRLLLSRDFAGQRPLFFSDARAGLAVASLARGGHASGAVPREVDETRLMEVLAGLPHEGSRSFFKHVERVEPGEAVAVHPGGRSARRFWSAPDGEIRLRSHRDYADALNETLDRAVAAQLRGGGEVVATHLSAGLDSSAVTASAALQRQGRIAAFTSVPSGDLPPLPAGRFANEGPLAAETAALYPNVEHRTIGTGGRIPLEELGAQLALFERVDLNLPNLAWSNRINDAAAASGARILLTGATGNQTISYGGLDILQDLLADGRFGDFLCEALAAKRAGFPVRALVGAPLRQFLPRRLLGALTRLRHGERHPATAGALNLAAPGAAEVLARYDQLAARYLGRSRDVRVQMLRRVDLGTYNKGVLAGWNIELRDPTADRRVVEFCLRVPLREYFRGGTTRALIRTALEGRVPEAVRLERARGLQAADWLALLSPARGEMTRILERIGGSAQARRLLDLDAMRAMLEAWPSQPGTGGSLAYRYGLLRGLSAGEFIRLHSG